MFRRVHLVVTVWNKEAYGMFNLHAESYEVNSFHYLLSETRYFYGNEPLSQIYFDADQLANPGYGSLRKCVLKFSEKPLKMEENYISALVKSPVVSQSLWILIEDQPKQKKFVLQENDVVRFGRQKVRFLKIHKYVKHEISSSKVQPKGYTKCLSRTISMNQIENDQSSKILTQMDLKQEDRISEYKSYGSNSVLCRICMEGPTESDPFEVDLCLCSKNMPAHVTCIIKWMSKKCQKASKNGVTFFDFTSLTCDICKSPYPSRVLLNGESHSIVDVKYSEYKSHIALEVLENDSDVAKGVYVIDIDNKKEKIITIGRNERNDIAFKDISVSRHHANIHWIDGKVYVFDQNSKFGSLKLIQDKLIFKECHDKKIILDKFMFQFHVMKKRDCPCMKRIRDIWHNPNDRSSLEMYLTLKSRNVKKQKSKSVKAKTKNSYNFPLRVIELPDVNFQPEIAIHNNNLIVHSANVHPVNNLDMESHLLNRSSSISEEGAQPNEVVREPFADLPEERNMVIIGDQILAETHFNVNNFTDMGDQPTMRESSFPLNETRSENQYNRIDQTEDDSNCDIEDIQKEENSDLHGRQPHGETGESREKKREANYTKSEYIQDEHFSKEGPQINFEAFHKKVQSGDSSDFKENSRMVQHSNQLSQIHAKSQRSDDFPPKKKKPTVLDQPSPNNTFDQTLNS